MRQDRLDRVARRAEFLLRRSQDPQAEMAWAERRLFEQDLWHGEPPGNRRDSGIFMIGVDILSLRDSLCIRLG